MGNRRAFLGVLTVVSSAGVALSMSAQSSAQSGPASPSPKAAKAPSPAALAVAATFRAFDAKLTDADVAVIARNIDDSRNAASTLNPKSKPLRNSDEMVVRFAADERDPG